MFDLIALNKQASCCGLLMHGILISLSFSYLIADKSEFRGSIFLVKGDTETLGYRCAHYFVNKLSDFLSIRVVQ